MSPPAHVYNLDHDEVTALVLGLLLVFFPVSQVLLSWFKPSR